MNVIETTGHASLSARAALAKALDVTPDGLDLPEVHELGILLTTFQLRARHS